MGRAGAEGEALQAEQPGLVFLGLELAGGGEAEGEATVEIGPAHLPAPAAGSEGAHRRAFGGAADMPARAPAHRQADDPVDLVGGIGRDERLSTLPSVSAPWL
jgi:hypothetical protein